MKVILTPAHLDDGEHEQDNMIEIFYLLYLITHDQRNYMRGITEKKKELVNCYKYLERAND